VLVEGELTKSDVIRGESVRQLIADEQAGREDYAKQIWQLLTLELWYRHVRSMGVTA
jgi:asparagine synthase (glutamine-hydrolysing)